MATVPSNWIGPYQIEAELGRGGMGLVYLAFDPAIGRELAVKVIRMDMFSDPREMEQLRLRLSREASAAGRLNHPGIVTVFQLGEHGSSVYIAMEFVRGTALDERLKSGPMRDTGEVLRLLEQVADALDYAHSMGVVHRDVKPANVLVRPDGKAKITDFGIARICSQNFTQTGTVLGTPEYMAPEQIQALPIDGRADQFSLAVMAFFMLSGRKPFEAATASAVLMQIVQADPVPLHHANSQMPAAASRVLKRALAKSSNDRFGSCGEFVAALRSALVAAPAPSVSKKPTRRRMVVFGLLAAVTAGIIAGAALWPSPPAPAQKPVVSQAIPTVLPSPAPQNTITNEIDGLTYALVGQNGPGPSFYISRTEVTADAFARFRPQTRSKGLVPVSGVTWDDASAYCKWAGGRLPAETEWESAAGAGELPVTEVAWFNGNSGGRVRQVGGKQPNASGLYDMQGNVWEWMADARGSERILRGGSAMSARQHVKISSRWTLPAQAKDSMIGFRCVMDLPR